MNRNLEPDRANKNASAARKPFKIRIARVAYENFNASIRVVGERGPSGTVMPDGRLAAQIPCFANGGASGTVTWEAAPLAAPHVYTGAALLQRPWNSGVRG